MAKKPSRPKGVRRVARGTNPKRFPLDRAYAQTLRTDRTLSLKSQADRANYWAMQRARQSEQDKQDLDYVQSDISEGTFEESLAFESANISEATLESSPAPSGLSTDMQADIAGLQGGIAPPPPPR